MTDKNDLSETTRVMNEARELIESRLPEACREVSVWRNTGTLPNGVVREAEQILRQAQEHYSLSIAEHMVTGAAIRRVAGERE